MTRKLLLYVTGITQYLSEHKTVNNIHYYHCSSSGVFMANVHVNFGFGCISGLPVTDISEMVAAFLHVLQLLSSSEDEKVQHNFQNSPPLSYISTQYNPQ
jgi:O-acetylhomoserine/O-acetylserine sulfhydrylase-like pyridoxal-dependent enzyme